MKKVFLFLLLVATLMSCGNKFENDKKHLFSNFWQLSSVEKSGEKMCFDITYLKLNENNGGYTFSETGEIRGLLGYDSLICKNEKTILKTLIIIFDETFFNSEFKNVTVMTDGDFLSLTTGENVFRFTNVNDKNILTVLENEKANNTLTDKRELIID